MRCYLSLKQISDRTLQPRFCVHRIPVGQTLSPVSRSSPRPGQPEVLVVVVAGTSLPLLRQSAQRLRRDLQIDDPDGHLRWRTYTNPTDDENTRRFIQQSLDEWNDPDVPTMRRLLSW